MPPKLNLTDGKFGRLLVLRESEIRISGRVCWVCRCECGTIKVVSGNLLTESKTRSCGCLRSELRTERNIKHGFCGTPEYKAWKDMKSRCNDENRTDYKRYGGRGIKVCKEWMDSFSKFISNMGLKPSPKHSLDRINNDGDYRPNNCRWGTIREQANNKRNNRILVIKGRSKTLAEWCLIYGANRDKIKSRLKLGWTPEKAFEIC